MRNGIEISPDPVGSNIGAFFLLGRFQVRSAGQAVAAPHGRKIQDLLGYLLLFRHRPHHRELLADALWSGSDTSQARKYLRQALWHLQSAVGGLASEDPLLIVENDWIRVNPEARIWLDIAEFEESFEQARGIHGRDLSPAHAAALKRAATLYTGELLEGWYQDWCVFERERFKARYLSTLEKLLEYADARHELEDALLYGEQVLQHDRAHERTHARMMRLHYEAGDRTAALRQYRQCVEVLDREFGARPAAKTIELYERIRDDR